MLAPRRAAADAADIGPAPRPVGLRGGVVVSSPAPRLSGHPNLVVCWFALDQQPSLITRWGSYRGRLRWPSGCVPHPARVWQQRPTSHSRPAGPHVGASGIGPAAVRVHRAWSMACGFGRARGGCAPADGPRRRPVVRTAPSGCGVGRSVGGVSVLFAVGRPGPLSFSAPARAILSPGVFRCESSGRTVLVHLVGQSHMSH